MRQTNHRGLHRTPRGDAHGPFHPSNLLRLSVLLPVIAVALGVGAFAVVNSATGSAAPAAPAATPNPDCTMTVPANPLTAQGLATPWRLAATDPAQGRCDEANTAQSAFVEATIIDPATGKLSVYRPLVVDSGAQPAAPDVVPTLPANAVVGIWVGFNGNNLTLRADNGSLTAGHCVNGLDGSIFGQVSYCNAPAFFQAANTAITKGLTKIPALATARDGMPCMTTRDFGLVDQDQSDNVVTSYLVQPNGSVAQNNAKNAAALNNSATLVNGSDNLLLDGFVDPALGCSPWTAPDLTNGGQQVGSLALDELFAAARQGRPVALVPENDPMTLDNGNPSAAKTNLYRQGADMPPYNRWTESSTSYCTNLDNIGAKRIQQDKNFFLAAPSPDPAAANNLYTFLAQRWGASLTNLGCDKLIRLPKTPVRLTTDPSGVVTDAVFAAPTNARPPGGNPWDNGDGWSARHAPHRPHKY